MGKNKAKNKNKAKHSKKFSNENVNPKPQTTPPAAQEKNVTQTAFEANDSSARKRTVAAENKKETSELSPTIPRKEKPHAKDPPPKNNPAHIPKVKRDSVISTTCTAPQQTPQAPVKPPPRRRLRTHTQLWRWLREFWPLRFVRWIYHFVLALTRVNWNDQQRFVDGALTLGLVVLIAFVSYIVLGYFNVSPWLKIATWSVLGKRLGGWMRRGLVYCWNRAREVRGWRG